MLRGGKKKKKERVRIVPGASLAHMTGLGPREPIKIILGYSRLLKWMQKFGHFVLIW
jgi:hypothetical protein